MAPAWARLGDLFHHSTATQTSDDTKATQLPPYHGVKHAIGVIDFSANGDVSVDSEVVGNMQAMLESALASTGRFVVVERGNLNAVAQEQNLQASGHAAKASDVARTGQVRSARYLCAGTITEVSTSTSGNTGGLQFGGIQIGGSSPRPRSW